MNTPLTPRWSEDKIKAWCVKNLRWARERQNLSQGQLASALGIERYAIMRIESGKRQLLFSEAVRIAAALGVEVGHIARPPSQFRKSVA